MIQYQFSITIAANVGFLSNNKVEILHDSHEVEECDYSLKAIQQFVH